MFVILVYLQSVPLTVYYPPPHPFWYVHKINKLSTPPATWVHTKNAQTPNVQFFSKMATITYSKYIADLNCGYGSWVQVTVRPCKRTKNICKRCYFYFLSSAQGGLYLLTLIDNYLGFSLLVMIVLEFLAVTFIHGMCPQL